MGEKYDLSDFDYGVIVDWFQTVSLSILETADLLGFSHNSFYSEWCGKTTNEKTSSEQQFYGLKRLDDERGQRIMRRLELTERLRTVR